MKGKLELESGLRHILYIDDDPDIQAVAQVALEMIGGYRMTMCLHPQQALSLALEHAPDLILLDVVMPGMDGPQTLATLHADERCKAIPVIFMTGRAQDDERARWMSLGVLGVIAKPFDAMALAGQIETIWSNSRRQGG